MAQLLHPYLYRDTPDAKIAPDNPARAPHFAPQRHHRSHAASHELPGLEDTVRQLFHMTLVSLRSYREVAHITSDAGLANFIEVLIAQRAAQCRALAQMSHSLYRQLNNLGHEDELQADPSAADLHLVWLRTIWSFEQEEFGRFTDNVEQAESALEDAYLSAANAFRNTGVAAIFRQFAMNICGARQRWEELGNTLVNNQ